MKSKHINIPIFIPHLGCPNDCVFCNQRIISGVCEFSPESVVPIIESVLSGASEKSKIEIAFFGGSFTGIDRTLMEELLKIANGYLKQGRICSIRCSTRPDYISEDILDVLKHYGVGTIELGIQSASDAVLEKSKRGHTFLDTEKAVALIRSYGFRLGGQMMIGLPGASRADEIKTAEFIASVSNEARIYPTIVFNQTELKAMMQMGGYHPLTLDEAIERSAAAFSVLVKNNVKILRVGLCDSENLHSEDTFFAGPNHAAMGELVENEYYLQEISELLDKLELNDGDILRVYVSKGHTSKVIGQHKKNKIRLLEKYSLTSIFVTECDEISEYEIRLKLEERK